MGNLGRDLQDLAKGTSPLEGDILEMTPRGWAFVQVSGTRLTYVPVAVSPGATLAPDFTSTLMVVATLGENLTMSAPVGLVPGDTVFIVIKHSAGPWTITWDVIYDFPGGTAPTLTGGKDIVTMVVDDLGEISAVFSANFS